MLRSFSLKPRYTNILRPVSEADVELWLKRVGEIGALKDVRVTSDAEGRYILDTPLRCARPATIGKAAENGEADREFIFVIIVW